jgi:cephalosporin-C deacetylase
VVGHGYGGRDAPDLSLPIAQAATLFPCARGISRSSHPAVPGEPNLHVLHGIHSRDSYVLGGASADTVWCAASALHELVPETASRFDYIGISFGGGIGALALPWDRRFHSGHLNVPTFGNHPLRLTLPCVGSGEAIRHHHLQHPDVLEVLRYFDAASAAYRRQRGRSFLVLRSDSFWISTTSGEFSSLIAKLQIVPRDGKPLNTLPDRDTTWKSVVQEIKIA